MTGFGRGSAQAGPITATVEMRSVNSRYCEVSMRLPRDLNDREQEIQARIKSAFDRGRISVQVQLEKTADTAIPVQVNEKAAQAYGRLLERLRQAAGIEAPVGLEHLLTFSEVFEPAEERTENTEEAWEALQAALEEAMAGMDEMRRREGRALRDDLEARVDAIAAQMEKVEARAPERVAEARARLHARVEELLGEERVDRDRLELEIALLADRLDVTEECVRLRSHLQVFREALAAGEPVGRKLNFLSQEINREVNTIGSKANDPEVAHLAVVMKEELEKIREQIQNVE